jgi:hypothetical protein
MKADHFEKVKVNNVQLNIPMQFLSPKVSHHSHFHDSIPIFNITQFRQKRTLN